MRSQLLGKNAIRRRRSRQIYVGGVPVGGDAPISVQSMTNTETTDTEATVRQVFALQRAGADIVRLAVPDMNAAEAFGSIRRQVSVPLVADIHFDYRIALRAAESGADCLRINPGNIGRQHRIRAVVDKARERSIPIRIGVNVGSLENSLLRVYGEPNADALVESALRHVDILDKLDFQDFKVSVKASDVLMAVTAYRKLAAQIEQPLHLGLTGAGGLRAGTVKSSLGLGMLLMEGIGDTLRVSLAADPVEEVRVAWDLLKSLGLRSKGVNLVACPGCARQHFDVAKATCDLEQRLEDLETPFKLAVMGCEVNGPGEARIADLGIAGGKSGHLVYINGAPEQKLGSQNLTESVEQLVRKSAKQKAEQQA